MNQKGNLKIDTIVYINLVCNKFWVATQLGKDGHFNKQCSKTGLLYERSKIGYNPHTVHNYFQVVKYF